MKPRATHEKRRKELLRREKQKDKVERRAQRKAAKDNPSLEDGETIDTGETIEEIAIPSLEGAIHA